MDSPNHRAILPRAHSAKSMRAQAMQGDLSERLRLIRTPLPPGHSDLGSSFRGVQPLARLHLAPDAKSPARGRALFTFDVTTSERLQLGESFRNAIRDHCPSQAHSCSCSLLRRARSCLHPTEPNQATDQRHDDGYDPHKFSQLHPFLWLVKAEKARLQLIMAAESTDRRQECQMASYAGLPIHPHWTESQ